MTRRQVAALFVLCLAVFMVAVDGTVVSVAVPAITEQLQPSYNQVLWIGDIYSFVLAGLLITMGNLGDRIGRKRLLLISSVAFGVASAAAAMAPTAEVLILARVIQGMAGAGLMPSTLALLRAVFTDDRQRMRAVGIWSAGGRPVRRSVRPSPVFCWSTTTGAQCFW
ncbi:MAG: MFS transporter [Mycobacterium sp.]|nr:MFS transporter [Mycobacterium sp.]